MTHRTKLLWAVVGALTLAVSTTAHAETSCEFARQGDHWTLQGDCETDEPLVVPDGVTLDGDDHRITAVDPPGSHFKGAVVRNGGRVAHVRDLVIDTRALADVCNSPRAPDDRLRGILMDSASGSIVGNRVLNIRQGRSGCQEGHAIEARNSPRGAVEGAEARPSQRVYIAGNHVKGYQKTGILVVGDVEAQVYVNRVVGLGPVDFIAQNGIQIGRGARGRVSLNDVRFNLFTQPSYTATGILLLEGDAGIEVTLNKVAECDVGIRLAQTSEALISGNRVERSTFDGISVDGLEGPARDHRIVANRVGANDVGINVFGAGASGNIVRSNRVLGNATAGIQLALQADANWVHRNRVHDSGLFGIWVGSDDNGIILNRVRATRGAGLHVEGERNQVRFNHVRRSLELDIENQGSNEYRRNACGSSSGPPVGCP